MNIPKKKLTIISLLLLILVVASFFRLWKLNSIPPGLYPDEAINGNDAWQTLNTKNFKVFYPENNGREGLFIWLLALSFSIFGISLWALKIVPAIIGILTVFGLYLLTKELFFNNNRRIALLSSFFLAISFWHINFSRIGFRAILLPFILIFSFYFFFKFLNRLKIKNQFSKNQDYIRLYSSIILAGITFGLGFYTYISYRFVVILLFLVLALCGLIYWKQIFKKTFLLGVFLLLWTIFLTALPIGLYFLQNPQDFVGRATPISIFSAENPIKELGKSLILHLGMFNFYGDHNWRHNFSGSPLLFWPIGILFLIGFFLSIRELINFRKYKALVISHFSLVSWFILMLLPGILTYEGIPHALRVIGVIPAVYIFAGRGGNFIYHFIYQKIKYSNILKNLLIFGIILFLVFYQYQKYFFLWGKHPETENAFSKDYVEMGNFLNSLPEEISKYVLVNASGVPVPYPKGIPMPAQTLMFIEKTKFGKSRTVYLLPKDLKKIKIEKETIIMLMRYDQDLFNKLEINFPEGKIQEKNGLWLYKINF